MEEDYEELKKLGSGSQGTVCLGRCKKNQKIVVLKTIDRCDVLIWKEEGKLPMEIHILNSLQSVDGVVHLIEWFWKEDSKRLVLVLEYHKDFIDLFDYITDKGKVNENDARIIFRNVYVILQKIKKNGFAHLDIKDENILINPQTLEVKMIDFGHSMKWNDNIIHVSVGTDVYRPPEFLMHHQFRCDAVTVWSLGILLYDLVCGDVPFKQDAEILRANLIFCDSLQLSNNCKDIIKKCLEPDTKKRCSFDEINTHIWLQEGFQ